MSDLDENTNKNSGFWPQTTPTQIFVICEEPWDIRQAIFIWSQIRCFFNNCNKKNLQIIFSIILLWFFFAVEALQNLRINKYICTRMHVKKIRYVHISYKIKIPVILKFVTYSYIFYCSSITVIFRSYGVFANPNNM